MDIFKGRMVGGREDWAPGACQRYDKLVSFYELFYGIIHLTKPEKGVKMEREKEKILYIRANFS